MTVSGSFEEPGLLVEDKSLRAYILDPELPKSIAYSGIANPLEVHCRLGHPFLSLLKKLFPQFSSLSLLNCESCQYAKLHRMHLNIRANKQASAPFELVHSDVWVLV